MMIAETCGFQVRVPVVIVVPTLGWQANWVEEMMLVTRAITFAVLFRCRWT